MNQFKAGDLALVVSASHSDNLGKVVELVQFTTDEIIVLQDGGQVANPKMLACWEISAESLFATSKLRPEGFSTNRAAIPERNLMPLRGDFAPDQQKQNEVPA